jgi:hypothetical protein
MRTRHQDRPIARQHRHEHRVVLHSRPTPPMGTEPPAARPRKIGRQPAGLSAHAHKAGRPPTRQERLSALRFREQLAEVNGR